MIYALTMFVVMNYITAILVAIVEKKWIKRKLGLKAIFGKIGIIVLEQNRCAMACQGYA